MADLAPPRLPGSRETEQIRGTCSPCDHFLLDSYECRLLLQPGWFLKVFEDKNCRPRRFVEEFLVSRLWRRYGSRDAARWDAEDIASEVVLSLYETPPRDGFLSNDLIGLRRLLAARAVQGEVHFRRKREGRVRCGNCEHHRARRGRDRVCGHPDPDHPWSGRMVKASLDPRTFEPPCKTYKVKRRFEEAGDDGQDPLDRVASAEELPDVAVAVEDRNRVLLECLRSIQQVDPRLSFVITMTFFKGMSNEDIARELACSTKSVVRYKTKALSLLQSELRKRGLGDLKDLT